MSLPTPIPRTLPLTTTFNRSYVVLLAATAALGGLLFGFDIAIITGAGSFLEQRFQLSHLELGWAFSSLLYGCVVGAAFAGWCGDRFGRRGPLIVIAALFTLTSVATGLAPSFALFIVARIVGGIAVGGVSVLAPMYVSEVAPAALRGRMGALYQLAIVVGILGSYCINYALRNVGDWNWRWMFISGALPSLGFLLLMARAPETPRYLIKVGRMAEARTLLTRTAGPERGAIEADEITASLANRSGGWSQLKEPGPRRAVWLTFILAVLVQISGVNTIVDYAPRIFQSAGWTIDTALLSTFLLGGINLVFTLFSFVLIDRWGRKPCYILGSLGMALSLAVLTVAALVDHFAGPIVLAAVLLFVAFFASCIGPVFWTVLPELLPNRVRGEAMTIPVLTQWLVNAVVVMVFPWVFSHAGKAASFGFLTLMALWQFWFAWRRMPETKGKTLEEIEEIFQ